MTGEPTTCRSCPARVIFVPSARSGKTMILDAEPKKMVIVAVPGLGVDGGILTKREVYADAGPYMAGFAPDQHDSREAYVVDVFTPHHATCPAAKSWSGRNRSNPPGPVPEGKVDSRPEGAR